jgi:hypothetical protein
MTISTCTGPRSNQLEWPTTAVAASGSAGSVNL